MRFLRISPLRSLTIAAAASLAPAALFAQEGGLRPFMQPDTGLMFWTLIIFAILLWVLAKFAFGPLTAAVRAREQSLQSALDSARADREAAAKLLADHQAKIEAARDEAQKIIVDARGTAERMRADLLDQARKEQQDILDRAQREIANERDKAIAQLRREAVDLALAGASRVIEQNLQTDTNRKLVESYLASIGTLETTR